MALPTRSSPPVLWRTSIIRAFIPSRAVEHVPADALGFEEGIAVMKVLPECLEAGLGEAEVGGILCPDGRRHHEQQQQCQDKLLDQRLLAE
jgi:hypothetical protein